MSRTSFTSSTLAARPERGADGFVADKGGGHWRLPVPPVSVTSLALRDPRRTFNRLAMLQAGPMPLAPPARVLTPKREVGRGARQIAHGPLPSGRIAGSDLAAGAGFGGSSTSERGGHGAGSTIPMAASVSRAALRRPSPHAGDNAGPATRGGCRPQTAKSASAADRARRSTRKHEDRCSGGSHSNTRSRCAGTPRLLPVQAACRAHAARRCSRPRTVDAIERPYRGRARAVRSSSNGFDGFRSSPSRTSSSLRHPSSTMSFDGFRSASSGGSSNIWKPEGGVDVAPTDSRPEANSPKPLGAPTAKTSKTPLSAVFAVAASKADGFSRSDSSETGASVGDRLAGISSDPDFSGFLVLPTVKTAETPCSAVPLAIGGSPLRSRPPAGDRPSEVGGGPIFRDP